jgi:hypothetical protein
LTASGDSGNGPAVAFKIGLSGAPPPFARHGAAMNPKSKRASVSPNDYIVTRYIAILAGSIAMSATPPFRLRCTHCLRYGARSHTVAVELYAASIFRPSLCLASRRSNVLTRWRV